MAVCANCVDAFDTIEAFPENQVCYGKQISAIYAQAMAGSPFDGVAIAGTVGGDISLEADWAAKAAASDEDKIIALPYLSGIQFPDPTVQELTGTEAPYGLPIVTESLYQITFDFIHLHAAVYDQFIAMACWGNVRIWIQDELGYVYGEQVATTTGNGIVNAKFTPVSWGFPGTGQAKPQFLRGRVSWRDRIGKPVAETSLDFLQTVFAAA